MQRIVFDNENKKSYEIADSKGNVRGVINVETTDLDIFARAEEAADNIQVILGAVKDDDKDMIAQMIETDKRVKEQIDYIFGSNVSDIVFGAKNCLNMIKGKTLAETFVETIMKEIRKDFEKAAGKNKSNPESSNVMKYTRGYAKRSRKQWNK